MSSCQFVCLSSCSFDRMQSRAGAALLPCKREDLWSSPCVVMQSRGFVGGEAAAYSEDTRWMFELTPSSMKVEFTSAANGKYFLFPVIDRRAHV